MKHVSERKVWGKMGKYKNPLRLENQWSEYECGDPFIMRFNGLYYFYCSSAGEYIKCWTSENLIDFTYMGSVCDDPLITGAYAPEVTYYKGRFYMITSPKGSGHYLLEAENPTGPFRIISDNYGLAIDGSFFVDDDGKEYMLRAGHNGIVIHTMPFPNQIDVNGKLIPAAYLNYWTEGPMILKRNGFYYLTYTGNHLLSKGYRVAYSVSETAPDHGYVNLKNRTLLIENDPEFHALGHSSSFLAPDLDSYCIAYHSFDLDSNPHRRSANIDRLYFNGARMYCNPIWWEQAAHRMPDFSCRGTEKLQEITLEQNTYWVTPVETTANYTAEWNVKPGSQEIHLIYGLKEKRFGSIRLRRDHTYLILECDEEKASGRLNDAISFDGNITIRFAVKTDGVMDVYINDKHLCRYPTQFEEGVFGIEKKSSDVIGYIAFSSCTEGDGDKYADKAIPGRFDAIHCWEEIQKVPFHEAGLTIYAGLLATEKPYTYSVNVKSAGVYRLIAKMKSTLRECEIHAMTESGETILTGSLSGICNEGGYEKVWIGNLYLEQGIQKIVFKAYGDDVIIDAFEFVRHSDATPMEVVKDGSLVTDSLRILGHKSTKSLIHKYCGFTCAENHGMGFLGEDGMSDYRIACVINLNSCDTGDLSIYLRVTKESWFHAQLAEALFGYRIRINVDGIRLYRESYDEKFLAFYSFGELSSAAKQELTMEAKQSKITVSIGDRVVIQYVDPEPYLYGKIGMEATGEGFGLEYLRVY
ncbi:MAG TPA: hypothetical protein DEP17_11225 [Lachnospiraceae bacterium]|nr:hypothetical protein [Lachnospiraceae bacterium]